MRKCDPYTEPDTEPDGNELPTRPHFKFYFSLLGLICSFLQHLDFSVEQTLADTVGMWSRLKEPGGGCRKTAK